MPGSVYGMPDHKFRQVGVFDSYCAQQKLLLFGANSKRHSAVFIYGDARHIQLHLYTLKSYIGIDGNASVTEMGQQLSRPARPSSELWR